jgi:NDP-sugar pyrophosphorylase family protein
MTLNAYPVLILCGRDQKRRELLEVHDPEGIYPSKSMLPMHGKRVLDWQLESMCDSPYVGEIYLIGLSPDEFPCPQKLNYISAERTTTILEKIILGSQIIIDKYPELDHLIICTGDVPGISTESINKFFMKLDQNIDADLLLSAVPEDITLLEFPEHGRVVGRFKDQAIYPGEMLAFRHTIIPTLMDEIDQLTERRRQFNRRSDTSKLIPVMRYLARKPGLWMLILKYLVGKLSVGQMESILSRVYGMKLKAIIISDPGFGMDMDLPEDYQKLADYVLKTKLQTI